MDHVGNLYDYLYKPIRRDRHDRVKWRAHACCPQRPRELLPPLQICFNSKLCGTWILDYVNISKWAFKIAGGMTLFLVALDMLAANGQLHKRAKNKGSGEPCCWQTGSINLAIHSPAGSPLAET